jgi:NadR type nicotinamide-nucleotide adenylyltransferase
MEEITRQLKTSVLKVVLFGPESSGKTTLSRQLSEYYQAPWVPEYAREFLQLKYDSTKEACTYEDLIFIAQGQIRLENEAVKKAKLMGSDLIICDTDLLETSVYSAVYFDGKIDPVLQEAVANNTYDLYLLTYIDTPWEPDDLRDKPNERKEMFEVFESKLVENSLPFITLKGDKETRLVAAKKRIDDLLRNHAL